MARILALLTPMALLAMACQEQGPAANSTGASAGSAQCFLQAAPGSPIVLDGDTLEQAWDTLYIRMDVLGELVNGVYNQLPYEQDPTTGTFTGTLENGVVTALYTYTTEGMETRQEVLFKLVDGGLRIGQGELVEREGAWVFKDKGQAEYGPVVPQAECL